VPTCLEQETGLLYLLPVPDRPWQYITVDFKKYPESKDDYNMVIIFIDRLGKRSISIFIRNIVIVRDLVSIFLI